MHLHPTAEQLANLMALPQGKPLVMLNLLRFAAEAKRGHGCDGMTGEEAFAEYGRRLRRLPPDLFTAEPFWFGDAQATVIGPESERWDRMLLVRYASIAGFVAMITSPDYKAAALARTAALDDSRLILLTQAVN